MISLIKGSSCIAVKRILLEIVLGISKAALRLRDLNVFMWQSLSYEGFHYFKFETDFLENFFKKPVYPFLVESTKIENALFSYKTVISKANIKTNEMISKK